MISRKKNQKNTCVSLIKQHWNMMAEIPQKCDVFTWSIQNFIRKVKQFVKKYISRLIYLANKLYEVEKFLDFILSHMFFFY